MDRLGIRSIAYGAATDDSWAGRQAGRQRQSSAVLGQPTSTTPPIRGHGCDGEGCVTSLGNGSYDLAVGDCRLPNRPRRPGPSPPKPAFALFSQHSPPSRRQSGASDACLSRSPTCRDRETKEGESPLPGLYCEFPPTGPIEPTSHPFEIDN